MTEQLYRADAYAREITAKVVAINERGGIVLDRTNFYASAGGQPGDKGVLRFAGRRMPDRHHGLRRRQDDHRARARGRRRQARQSATR